MITLGIDIGSITTKAALLEDNSILDTIVIFSGYNSKKSGQRVFNEILSKNSLNINDIYKIVSTGYGRSNVDFADKNITEISCHGAGAHFLNPKVRTVIDIGGQDSKAIAINSDGSVKDFTMNDKCAAGTGRFLEVMARALESNLEEFGDLSIKSKGPSKISSTCTVFAESEVISLISRGEKRENIIAGIHESIAARVSAMAKRIGITEPLMMTGGVAKNSGIVSALEIKLGLKIDVMEYAQTNGAIGAAVLAKKL